MDKKKFAGGLLTILLVIGAISGAYSYVTSSASGRVSLPLHKAAKANANQTTLISSHYANFTYPSVFTRTTSDQPVTPVVQNYNFIKQQIGSWQLAVQLTRLSTGSLSDDGSYNYRHIASSRYTSQTETVNGQPVVIFTDTTSQIFSKVAYLQHGNIDADISLLGGTPYDQVQLQAILQAMVASWHWN